MGILMTLGLSPRRVQSLFQWIGGFLFGIGLLSGLFLGVSISLFLQLYPLQVMPDIYYDRMLPSKLDVNMLVFLIVGATIVAFLASWIPARRMAKLSPVNALRKK